MAGRGCFLPPSPYSLGTMPLGTLGPWSPLPWLLKGRFHAERGTKKTEATTSPSTGHSAPKAEVSLRKTLQSHGSGVTSGGRRKKHKAENSKSLIKELTSFAKECGEVQASWWSQKRRMLGKTDGRSWVDLVDRFIGGQRLNCRPPSGQRESGRLRWEKQGFPWLGLHTSSLFFDCHRLSPPLPVYPTRLRTLVIRFSAYLVNLEWFHLNILNLITSANTPFQMSCSHRFLGLGPKRIFWGTTIQPTTFPLPKS